ncbi:unnamed protein product [Rhodiola kirilowii]
MGHFASDCQKKKNNEANNNNRNKGKNQRENQSNNCESGKSYDHELFVVTTANESDSWILDSGCNMHATPNRNVFSNLKLINDGEVRLGDQTVLHIRGIGNVPLRMHDGVVRVIQNVRWVPGLRRNLLSESAFDDLGCHITNFNGVREIMRNGRTVLKGLKKGGLYHVQATPEINAVTSAKDMDETKTWHTRLGHIGNKGLFHLYKQGIIDSAPVNIDFCENCIFGKQTALSFNKSTMTVKGPLDYIHADLWGPAQVSTIGGRNYFLSLVDHFSRKVWVFLLKTKDETFDKFKHWKALVENQSGCSVKCLRTDNGLEFCNGLFNKFCEEHGIDRHLTIPGTPQQNGTAERMNRTLLEKARCMLISSGIKSTLWGDALVTAAYLINRSPSSMIGFKTPQEMWTGHKPNINHLRPFGCTAFAKIDQGKLQPRAVKCVMIGYPHGVKGYKLLVIQPGSYKVIVARSVTFNEHDFYFKTKLMQSTEQTGNSEGPDVPFAFPQPQMENDDADNPVGEEFDVGYSVPNSADQGGSSSQNGNGENGAAPAAEQNELPHQSGGEVSSHIPTSSINTSPTSVGGLDNSGTVNVDDYSVVENNRTDLSNYVLARDRTPRERFRPKRYDMNLFEGCDKMIHYALLAAESVKFAVPETYEQALHDKNANEWIKAMHEEIQSMYENKTWTLVPKPSNVKTVACKWIYRIKEGNELDEPPRFKARLVAKGFTQKEGIDFNEIFAPVVKYKTMRLLIAMAAVYDWEIEQMDVKTAFLHGDLEETIYMNQPRGFIDKNSPDSVCLLNKSIYGLKQSPRQ